MPEFMGIGPQTEWRMDVEVLGEMVNRSYYSIGMRRQY